MNLDQFKSLLNENESQGLEWKKNWPPGLLESRKDPTWNKGRGKLLKNLISLANSSGPSPAYLVFGVKDLRARRKIFGISKVYICFPCLVSDPGTSLPKLIFLDKGVTSYPKPDEVYTFFFIRILILLLTFVDQQSFQCQLLFTFFEREI